MSDLTGRSPASRGSLASVGFTEVDGASKPSVMVCSSGHEKRGKTHWALTAPGPIAVVSSDTGTLEVCNKFKRAGKKIYYFEYAPLKRAATAETNLKIWDTVEKAVRTAVEDTGIRTLVVDTGTETWELLRLARFGKLTQVMPHHYGPVNAEFRELLKAVQKRPGLNSVWIHKVKKEYKTNREGKDSWTGKYERSGFTDFGYVCDVIVENYLDSESKEFGIRIVDSRYETAEVIGLELTGDMGSFQSLAQLLFPDTEEEYWT